ncbi:MAG TPA: trypsin-like peptidase domain-containing protein [Planctomycetota bacterium]|nr:trypsin-like peptidase domain-containing protein [Planctomycetota bacterium]
MPPTARTGNLCQESLRRLDLKPGRFFGMGLVETECMGPLAARQPFQGTIVAALALALGLQAAPGLSAAESRTLENLLARTSRWVVALDVERVRDVAPARIRSFAFTQETRSYYERPSGCVSGILIDAAGHVITSAYNVAGELKSIKAVLPDRKTLVARIVSKSAHDDVALLRLEGFEPPAGFEEPVWSDDAAFAPGRLVFALGRSPDPERLTVTRGIVSALTRNEGRVIQTDAKLNYGNVGGPMVDLDGGIIAMSSFVGHTQPQWGMNSGVGFGTRASILREIIPRLAAGEKIAAPLSPLLGVQCERVSPDEGGAKVLGVQDGSAASQAGIKSGDAIIAFEGVHLHDFDHLRRLIFSRKVGDKVKLKLEREGQTIEVEATLQARPSP